MLMTSPLSAAMLKVAVDGALDHLHCCKQLPLATHKLDMITGDFDSVQPKLLQLYRDQVRRRHWHYLVVLSCVFVIIQLLK